MIYVRNISRHVVDRKSIGLALLVIFSVVSLATLGWGQFGDEADNLVVGSLLQPDYKLYSDVFSHHFPFPYYWMAAVIGLFGKSILVARLSLLVFQIAAFAVSMKLSGNYLLIGVVALLWSVLRLFYLGNMVLYSSFAGTSLLAVMLVTMSLLQGNTTPDWRHWLAVGGFSAISIMSDPLTVYAVSISFAILFLRRPSWGIRLALPMIAILSLLAGVLLASDSLRSFWNDAVMFNSQVYSKYHYTNPVRLSDLSGTITSGLGIGDSTWFNFDPLRPISGEYSELGRWLYTGFLYRFSIIVCAAFLALTKRYWAAIYLYLFAAATLIIHPWHFRSQPFILVALVAVSAIVTNEWSLQVANLYLRFVQKVVRILVVLVAFWLIVRLAGNIYLNRHGLSYDTHFAALEGDAAYLKSLTCHQPDVLLAHYPLGGYYYWFTDLKPVSRYTFMWPWVAEVGLRDVIEELGQRELAIVVIQDDVIWGLYDTKEYLASLREFVEASYHEVAVGVFVSPELVARCQE